MARRKTTVYLDENLLAAAKVAAARARKHEYEIFEDALRRYLDLQDVVDQVWAGLGPDAPNEDDAMRIAAEELAAVRADRAQTRAS